MPKLSLRHETFCREYAIDLNGQRAAEAAGYKKESARSQASTLLTKSNIQERLAQIKQKQHAKLEISAERVLSELAKIGFVNSEDYLDENKNLDLKKATRDQMACISEITEDTTGGSGDGERRAVLRTKVKFWDKTRGLEMLGRHLKLYTDIVRHEGLESLVNTLGEKEQ